MNRRCGQKFQRACLAARRASNVGISVWPASIRSCGVAISDFCTTCHAPTSGRRPFSCSCNFFASSCERRILVGDDAPCAPLYEPRRPKLGDGDDAMPTFL